MMWIFILYVVAIPIKYGPYETELECQTHRTKAIHHYLIQHPDKHAALVIDCHKQVSP